MFICPFPIGLPLTGSRFTKFAWRTPSSGFPQLVHSLELRFAQRDPARPDEVFAICADSRQFDICQDEAIIATFTQFTVATEANPADVTFLRKIQAKRRRQTIVVLTARSANE